MKHPHLKDTTGYPGDTAPLQSSSTMAISSPVSTGSSCFSLLLPCHCFLKVTSDYAIATPFGYSYLS